MTLIVTDPVKLKGYVERMLDAGAFAFDCETINRKGDHVDFRLDPRRNIVVWLSFATQGLSFAVPVGHPHGEETGTTTEPRTGSDGKTRNFKIPTWSPAPVQLSRSEAFGILEPLFFDPDTVKVGHNVKFDLETVQKYYDGDVLTPPFWDTQVAAHMLNENHHEYKLGKVVAREFDFTYDKTLGERIERYGYHAAARYAHADAKWTWQLYQLYEPQIEAQGLDGLWRLEMDVLEVLLYMESEGAALDVDAATKLKKELGIRLDRIRGNLYRIAGKEINLNSNPQLQKLLFTPKRAGGFGLKPKVWTSGGKSGNKQPAVSKLALEPHVAHPFVEALVELGEVDKIHGTYLQAYLGGEVRKQSGDKVTIEMKPSILVRDPVSGVQKLHASFNQHGTVTGRFSCSAPNLQNIPRPDSELGQQIRGLIIAPPGEALVVADYGQIEYVVMAHLSRDPMLVRAFNEGLDLHQYVAAMVFSMDMDDVSKKQRTTAKNTNFAVAYGAGDDKVSTMSGISMEEAVKFRAAHKKMLPRLYKWTDQVVMEARRRRPPHVTTMLGRKRRLPGLLSSVWGIKSEAERQAVNTVVQGSAADLIKLAMVRFHRAADEEIRLSLSVHDELVAVCPMDRVDDAQAIMREAMLGEGIQSMLSVPMKIDMHVCQRWSEAKE